MADSDLFPRGVWGVGYEVTPPVVLFSALSHGGPQEVRFSPLELPMRAPLLLRLLAALQRSIGFPVRR